MKTTNRIKKNEDFVSTIRKGRALKSSSYIIHFNKNTLNICRIGISVSKKIGNAVTRNRCKRQIRSMCDNLTNYSQPFDIVIVIKENFLKEEFSKNNEMLKLLFKEIGIENEKKN